MRALRRLRWGLLRLLYPDWRVVGAALDRRSPTVAPEFLRHTRPDGERVVVVLVPHVGVARVTRRARQSWRSLRRLSGTHVVAQEFAPVTISIEDGLELTCDFSGCCDAHPKRDEPNGWRVA